MRQDLHDLTGVYALDALPEDERALFEEHLEECETCRQEVAELQATTASLADAVGQAPPAALKDRVLAEIDRTPQEPAPTRVSEELPLRPTAVEPRGGVTAERPASPTPGDDLAARRTSPSWWGRVLTMAAAVVAILVVGMSVVIGNLSQRVDELEAASSDMIDVLTAPDADAIIQGGREGPYARVVLSPSHGKAVFVAGGLEPAPQERTYELWLIGDDGAQPAGLFDVDETGSVTQLVTGDLERAGAIGVTVEPAGGSPEPTTEPVMLVELGEA